MASLITLLFFLPTAAFAVFMMVMMYYRYEHQQVLARNNMEVIPQWRFALVFLYLGMILLVALYICCI